MLFRSTIAADYPEAGNFSEGSKVWAENCNRCHNMRGPKELRDDQWISTAYHMRIRAGLTGQEMRDVLTFLQASNTKTVAAGATQVVAKISKGTTGEETYEKTCVACHSANGKGAFPGTPDFTDSSGALSKSDDVLINHITNGFQSPGSPMAMPPKSRRYRNPTGWATASAAAACCLRPAPRPGHPGEYWWSRAPGTTRRPD